MTQILGEIIRRRIREDGRTAKTICEDMGMSRGNLDKIYHKDSINTDLLAKFSLILGYDFFVHVNPFRKNEREDRLRNPRARAKNGDPNLEEAHTRLAEALEKLDRAQQELNYLRTMINDAKSSHKDKDEIINLMKDKISRQEQHIRDMEQKGA